MLSRLLAITTIVTGSGGGNGGEGAGEGAGLAAGDGVRPSRRGAAAAAGTIRQPLSPTRTAWPPAACASCRTASCGSIRPRIAGTRRWAIRLSVMTMLVPVCRASAIAARPACPAGLSTVAGRAETAAGNDSKASMAAPISALLRIVSVPPTPILRRSAERGHRAGLLARAGHFPPARSASCPIRCDAARWRAQR